MTLVAAVWYGAAWGGICRRHAFALGRLLTARRRSYRGGCVVSRVRVPGLIFFFCPGSAEYSPDCTVRTDASWDICRKMQTIVIGGGLAGLSAAHTVIERGGKVADASVFMRR